jgi:tungstate transport system substrate-binding protein
MADHRSRTPLDRRDFLALAGVGVVASGLMDGCSKKDAPAFAASSVPDTGSSIMHLVRVASVKTAVEGNVLPELISDFEKASHYKIELAPGEDVYTWAREGKADLIISHYGHREAEAFVLDGLGEWPRTIFSNQMALVGPHSDPAGVRGLEDAGEAFRRIAASKSKFVLNDIEGVRYLTEILWNAAGRPDRAEWFLDEGHRKDGAIERASEMGAYSFWGLTPFLRLSGQAPLKLEPLVLADPLLQRLLVSVVVMPGKVPGVNADGARALQAHLLSPATQAQIRSIRYPGDQRVCWVPAGRHNRTATLPKG